VRRQRKQTDPFSRQIGVNILMAVCSFVRALSKHLQEVGVDDAMAMRSVWLMVVIVDEMKMERGK
jgi:hypothetical protein